MDFWLTEEQRRLQQRCQELTADFATRSAEHDRDATHPIENYRRLREEGFCELNVPKEWGGSGIGLLGHTLAFEALAQGCPATALAFNMHASVVMPLMERATPCVVDMTGRIVREVALRRKQRPPPQPSLRGRVPSVVVAVAAPLDAADPVCPNRSVMEQGRTLGGRVTLGKPFEGVE